MLARRTVILIVIATGVALELGIEATSGRREAWDSAIYWTAGLPIAALVSVGVGVLSSQSDWLWSILLVPSQVTAMMVRSGEIGGLWPLAVVFSGILSAPFVVAAFVGSRFRPKR